MIPKTLNYEVGVLDKNFEERGKARRQLKNVSDICFYLCIFGAGACTALVIVAFYLLTPGHSFHCTKNYQSSALPVSPEHEVQSHGHPLDFIPSKSTDNCVFSIVESIPENLTFPEGAPLHPSTYSSLKDLIASAEQSIHIASSYWSLRAADLPFQDHSSQEGEDIFNSLMDAGNRKLTIRIVQNAPNNDTALLSDKTRSNPAEVRTVDFERLLGKGILHTKLWLVDGKHFYIGSANLDWRSLTQVKELGVLVRDCPSLGANLQNIFDVYWYLGDPAATIPKSWPSAFTTAINASNPLTVPFNGTSAPVYLSSSPPPFCPSGRTQDLDGLLDVVSGARKFVYIAVMDYSPSSLYLKHNTYWPTIDNALRSAAFDKRVTVRVLTSQWAHTKKDMYAFMCSLRAMGHLHYPKTHMEMKLFEVPAFTKNQSLIPYARVNHNKYMVTDQQAFIGTSNWSQDYFGWTGGVSFILRQNSTDKTNSFRQQLEDIFNRDWNSVYSKYLQCGNSSMTSTEH